MRSDPTGPVVGFDLDQTLVDSGPRISSCLRAALAEVDVVLDDAVAEASRGLPLEGTLAALLPAGRATPEVLADVAARYRAQDRLPDGEGGHPLVPALPHARAALEAVVAAGGRAVVVSAKRTEAVGRVLAWAGLDDLVVAVAGDRFGAQKADALLAEGAVVYVGDHPADLEAARAAGAAGVLVATGAHAVAELEVLGADAVLADLSGFPGWWQAWRQEERRASRPAPASAAPAGGAPPA
ncbi:HAD hydrolase-like protein [Pseudokineococcus basanitobsidens]|uniref:HAD hydrolase-like protein n=1 Tax=Pseudokineococcus basanitobsidens TaxID=1926649 RepID=A0ABU8RME5_9ACTN